jgi:ribosomal protein S14
MLFSKINDKKLRNKYNLLEYKKKVNKFILINLLHKFYLNKRKHNKLSYIHKLISLKLLRKKNYKNKIVSHCLLTNRTKSVYKRFYLSRSVLRDLMQFGLVPGYKKAVW